jgi:hypothetical protein
LQVSQVCIPQKEEKVRKIHLKADEKPVDRHFRYHHFAVWQETNLQTCDRLYRRLHSKGKPAPKPASRSTGRFYYSNTCKAHQEEKRHAMCDEIA